MEKVSDLFGFPPLFGKKRIEKQVIFHPSSASGGGKRSATTAGGRKRKKKNICVCVILRVNVILLIFISLPSSLPLSKIYL